MSSPYLFAQLRSAPALTVPVGKRLPAGWQAFAVAPAGSGGSALINRLTPDGFLLGVAQLNKAGEALQRGNYRVISKMAMGLMGQLVAALVVCQ